MNNGSFIAPVISPWSTDDGEAAYNITIPYTAYLSRCQCYKSDKATGLWFLLMA